jgi:hypothetical protein
VRGPRVRPGLWVGFSMGGDAKVFSILSPD